MAVVLLAGCAGMKARENVLLPTMALAFSTVIAPIIEASDPSSDVLLAVSAVRAALEAGDGEAVSAAWAVLEPAVLAAIDRRVDRGEIGPGVAGSLKEAVRLFGLQVVRLLEAP